VGPDRALLSIYRIYAASISSPTNREYSVLRSKYLKLSGLDGDGDFHFSCGTATVRPDAAAVVVCADGGEYFGTGIGASQTGTTTHSLGAFKVATGKFCLVDKLLDVVKATGPLEVDRVAFFDVQPRVSDRSEGPSDVVSLGTGQGNENGCKDVSQRGNLHFDGDERDGSNEFDGGQSQLSLDRHAYIQPGKDWRATERKIVNIFPHTCFSSRLTSPKNSVPDKNTRPNASLSVRVFICS
jgi:hypothetical protein